MFSDGFSLVITTAWNILHSVIIPAGSFGNSSDITFIHIMLLFLGTGFLIKFLRFCLGGHFNFYHDKDVKK